MVETPKPRMSKKLEASVKDVVGKNEASEDEDMKEVLEVEEVQRVEAVGSFGDEGDTKRASTTSGD
jgi:hypothetical protein